MEGRILNREVFGGWNKLINVLFLCKYCRLMIMRLVVDGWVNANGVRARQEF